ncbi:MAG: GNAT family N-acetyltransferase [Mesorhizobium sp.]
MNRIDPEDIRIERIDGGFGRWDELLSLILRSFAYMDGVIDPPSSAHRLSLSGLKEKASQETGFAACKGSRLVGCVFISEQADHFYLGKLAVEPGVQGSGIGRKLVEMAESEARESRKPAIELQTRIELSANRDTFGHFGFHEVGRTAHEGFDRPTSVTMRKVLS